MSRRARAPLGILLGSVILTVLAGPAHAVPRRFQFVGEANRPNLLAASGMALSPGGEHVYVTGGWYNLNTLNVFTRDTLTGRLGFVEAHQYDVGDLSTIPGANGVAVSPDGAHVYAASGSGGVAIFARDAGTGALTLLSTAQNGVGGYARAIVVSADGAHVYVANSGDYVNEGSVVAFARNAGTGALTFVGAYYDGFGGVDGIRYARSLVLSPDGAHLYVAGYLDSAVAWFSRDAGTGALTWAGLVRNNVGGVDGLAGAWDVAVSPDGAHVYAAGIDDDAVTVFTRDAGTGALTFVEAERNGVGGVGGVDHATSVTVSADGAHVYACGRPYGAGTVAVFSRDGGTGALTFVEYQQFAALYAPSNVVASADGNQVYLVAGEAGYDSYVGSVTAFSRDAGTGALTAVQSTADVYGSTDVVSADGAHVYIGSINGYGPAVFSRDAGSGILTFVESQVDGIAGVTGLQGGVSALALSPDGANLYAAAESSDAVVVFDRDAGSGKLTWVETERDGIGGVDGLDGARGVAVSPDGLHVYVTGSNDDAVAAFSRDGGTGALTFLGVQRDGVGGVDGLDGASDVVVSGDGADVYVTGSVDNAVVAFSRNAVTGALTFVEMERDGVAEINILNGARSLALSPDGAHLYVESPNTVAVFGRDAGSGALTFLGVERNLEDGVNGISGGDVAVSPDGEIVHASYATFARDAATGQLSFVANTGVGGTQIGVSPDGAHVYRGSDAFAMGFAGCGPTPLTGCRTSSTGTVRLLAPNTVYWRWSKGEATTLAEFGDPASTTDYALCMYDESGPPALVFRALAPAGGTCRVTNRSCWSQVGSNWKYRDAFRTPEGLLSVMLKPNVTGLAKIIVKGGRERVTLPTMPLGLPVRVQLQASTGECWESTYSSPVLNGPGGFTSPPD